MSSFSRVFAPFAVLFLTTEGRLLDYQGQWRNPLAGASFAVKQRKKVLPQSPNE
jgi:hypothetical protein